MGQASCYGNQAPPHRVWTGFLSCGEASTLLFQSHQRGSERQRERGKSECVAIFKKGWER